MNNAEAIRFLDAVQPKRYLGDGVYAAAPYPDEVWLYTDRLPADAPIRQADVVRHYMMLSRRELVHLFQFYRDTFGDDLRTGE